MLNFDFIPRLEKHPGIAVGGATFSGAELAKAAARIADALLAAGIREGHRIVLLFGNTAEFAASLLAVFGIKASAVLANPAFTARELQQALLRTQAAAILAPTQERQRFANFGCDEVTSIESLQRQVALFRTGLQSSAAAAERTVQFTSGGTGESKIVPRTSAHLADELDSFASRVNYGPDDTIVCPVPLFHTYGLINGLLLPLFTGARIALLERFLPADVADTVRQFRATVLIGVPAMYRGLSQSFSAARSDFASLRICFSAGSELLPSQFEEFRSRFGLRINQQYGSTETGAIAINLLDEGADPLAVGVPLPRREIRLGTSADAEEIAVRSPGSAVGYLHEPELTARHFLSGWYLTGDVGFLSEDGVLTIKGRRTAFINVGGYKVDPSEIENVLRGSAAVADCAVLGIPDDSNGGQYARAYVVARAVVTPSDLVAYCKQRLAAYKVPRQVCLVSSLPRTASGKILAKDLLHL
jgi:long-chain acyl-CoA synthetase